MDINKCIGVFEVVVKVVDFLYNIVFQFIPKIRVIFAGPEEEKVRGGILPSLKNSSFPDLGEVFFDYSFHAFIVDGTIGSQELSIGSMVVDDLGPEWFSSHNLRINNIELHYMETQHKNDPFSQYSLKQYHTLLHSIPGLDPKAKVKALVEGCLLRNRLKLYKGEQHFIEDLQVILDYDRQLAPLILKDQKIMVNKDGSTVLAQCKDCGKFMPPFRFCPKCQNAHFCSQACEVKSKLGHQAICRPRQVPAIDAALQIQLHVGGDLGKEVEVYYQHQLRMSLKIRGEEFVRSLFDFFIGEGKNMLPFDCRPQLVNGHLHMRRAQTNHIPSGNSPFVPEKVDQLCQIYSDNTVLGFLAIQCLKRGGVLSHVIRQAHDNHFHMIYIFLC